MDLDGLKLVFNDGEQLLWSGRPSKKAFKAGLFLSALFITGAMLLALLVTSSQNEPLFENGIYDIIFLLVVAVIVTALVIAYIRVLNTHAYVLTDRRAIELVLNRKNPIYQTMDFDSVNEVLISFGSGRGELIAYPVMVMLKTGSLEFYGNSKSRLPVMTWSVDDAERVHDLIKHTLMVYRESQSSKI